MSDDTTSSSFRIEPLKGDNYVTWRIQMTDILAELDLWEYVAGDNTSPPSDEARRADWKKKDAKALRAIRLRLAKDVLVYAQDAVSAKEAWDTLRDTFQPAGPIGIVTARRKLFRAQCPDAGDVEEHLRQMRTFRSELHALGQELSDSDFSMTILTSLPDSWDAFIRAIDPTDLIPPARGQPPKLSSAKLIARILQEDRRLKQRNEHTETALVSRGARDDSRVTCFNCGRRGHRQDKCRAPPASADQRARIQQTIRSSRPNTRPNPHRANVADAENPGAPTRDESHTHEADGQVFGTVWVADDSAREDVALSAVSDAWYLDSGATVHICKDRIFFYNYTETPGKTVKGVGGHEVPQLGRGTVPLIPRGRARDARLTNELTLTDVAHMPAATHNLISVSRITERGARITFHDDAVEIHAPDGTLLATGSKTGRLYRMDVDSGPERVLAAFQTRTWDEWHRIYAHLNHDYLRKLVKQGLVRGMDVDESVPPSPQCTSCIEAKHRVVPYPQKSNTSVAEVGDLTVADMWGPAHTRGINGELYLTVFTDVKSRHRVRYLSRDKAQQLHFIQSYRAFLKTQVGKRMKALRVDNGKEFVNDAIKAYLRSHGIRLELTAPYSSAQNGIAERSFLTIFNAARAMLFARDLPTFLWPEAASYSIYIANRSPTRALPDKTPYEAFWGRKPNVAHLQEFGADCWVLRQDPALHKLARKSRACKFMGFSEESRAYRFYNPDTRLVLTSRNVIFAKGESDDADPSVDTPPAAEGEPHTEQPPPATDPQVQGTPETSGKPSPSRIPQRASARQAKQFAATGRPDYHAQTSHARTKHIDIHYHYIRERIASNEVVVSHCPSEDNLADALTKALPRPRHQSLVARMGMHA